MANRRDPLQQRLPPADAEWGYGAGAFPLTEALHREVLSVPMGPQLTAAQQQSVVSVLNHP